MTGAVPVTILTGFLGAGKTTVLNRVLSESHGQRVAVIVNEFGELGVDGDLVAGAAGDVVELANGCLCCATRGQLLQAIHRVVSVSPPPEAILIETSGLADPFPVLSELAHSSLGDRVEVDGVITLVDASNFDRNLDSAEAAFQQILAADLLLVNKTDLVDPSIPPLVEQGIRVLNPTARVALCVAGAVPLAVLLGNRVAASAAAARHGHGHTHANAHDTAHDTAHGGFEAITLDPAGAYDMARLSAWFEALPADVFRAKGFVRLAGQPGRIAVSAVGARHAFTPAPAAATRERLVVIGRNLDAAALARGLAGCVAGNEAGPTPGRPQDKETGDAP
jgi:G3E family GTPase